MFAGGIEWNLLHEMGLSCDRYVLYRLNAIISWRNHDLKLGLLFGFRGGSRAATTFKMEAVSR